MYPSTTRRFVLRTAAALVAASAGLASPALAQNWHWIATNGSWSTGGNWNPAVPPNAASIVNIGNTGPAANGTVSLTGSVQMAQLNITDGMTLRNEHNSITVVGVTSISGSNTVAGPLGVLQVYPSRLALDSVDGSSLSTSSLIISDGARLSCSGQAFVSVGNQASTADVASISGIGYFNLNGAGITLLNGGRLVPGGGAGLVFRNNNGGLFDLDGGSANGVLDLSTTGDAYMRFIGSALADSFGGSILMTSGAELDMDLTSGWTADNASEIIVTTTPLAQAAIIRGGPMTAAGTIQVSGNGGWLFLDPVSLTFQSTFDADIAANNFIEVDQNTPTTLNGGTFNIGSSGNLSGGVAFHGPTTVHGGQFNMTVSDSSLAQLKFFGETTWDGAVNMTGNAGQYGDATVSGPTVINARRFIMSPNSEPFQTVWSINSGLVINAHAIGTTASSTWATINIGGGLLPKLTINLDDPNGYWAALGDVNIVGSGSIFVTRIAGSKMHTDGNFTLLSGKAQVAADTHFLAGTVNIGPADAELRMMGRTTVGGVTFTGQGLLRNGSTGDMTLSIGADLGQVGLLNEGRLDLGVTAIGTASVNRFTHAPGATWNVDIRGNDAGAQYDLLLVSGGGASIAGDLQVRLLPQGGVPFVPSIGDEFTILTSLGIVAGTFAAEPVTDSNGSRYHWTVIYNAHSIVLRLDAVTATPCNDADVAGLGGAIGADGLLTADDIIVFLNAFFAGNTAIADLAHLGGAAGPDGAITPDDLIYFLAMFFRPCDQ